MIFSLKTTRQHLLQLKVNSATQILYFCITNRPQIRLEIHNHTSEPHGFISDTSVSIFLCIATDKHLILLQYHSSPPGCLKYPSSVRQGIHHSGFPPCSSRTHSCPHGPKVGRTIFSIFLAGLYGEIEACGPI